MTGRPSRTSPWTVAFALLCAVLFVFGAVAQAEHAHHHDCPQAAQQCAACLAHASASAAVLVISDAPQIDVAVTEDEIVAPFFPVIAHTPLTLACRGPPPCS